jgi:hypothetical protein
MLVPLLFALGMASWTMVACEDDSVYRSGDVPAGITPDGGAPDGGAVVSGNDGGND